MSYPTDEPYFSQQAGSYSAFRPEYPFSFLERIANLCSKRELAWDCGTGNGQCARQLKRLFEHVVATDVSADQLSLAPREDGIRFIQAPAEKSPLDDNSVDLITAACAVHWFDQPRFFSEAARVAKPGGVIAVWTYFVPQIGSKIDDVVRKYYLDLLAPYYSAESRFYREQYRNLDFPFTEIENVEPEPIVEPWSGEKVLGFLGTYSARMTCLKRGHPDPLEEIRTDFQRVWGDLKQRRVVNLPLYSRIGRVA